MTAMLDEKELKKVDRDSEIPKSNAALRADRNRWYLVVIAMLCYCVYLQYQNHENFKLAQTNKELLYIKLDPTGNSEVTEFNPQDEQLYFKATIDQALERFLVARYSVNRETVRAEYGVAGVFMSEPMYADFISSQPGGYDAAQKATDIENNKNADRVDITWGFVDHYDAIPAVFDKKKSEVIRSNVYFTETTRSASGIVKQNGVKKKILRVQWRLLPKKELATRTAKWLRVNPVGVEIIHQDVIEDPAGYDVKEGAAK